MATCGDGNLSPPEECDDGNTINLDGCDAACKFEQDQRISYLSIQFGTDAYCTANHLGTAFASLLVQSTFHDTLAQGVASGALVTLFKLTGLEDLTGATDDPSIQVGAMGGLSVSNLPPDGLDWWHPVDPASIDANRNPLAFVPASISTGTLSAGPGTVVFAGFKMSSAKFQVPIGAPLAPLTSTGAPPGHLASEHLDPQLLSFGSTGQPNDAGAGELCGDISAESLVSIPVPPEIVSGPFGPTCSQAYTLSNTMLDVLVGGCKAQGIFTLIQPTQPDKVDPGAPVAGAGGPYTLSSNTQKVVSTCKDKNGATVNLATCLKAAAYSSAFKFATTRVIVK